jgi:ABC-type amino acid transport system permease subunit
MEAIIERVGTGIGSFAEFLTTSGAAFLIFAGLWVAFGVGPVWSQGSVTGASDWVRSLPLLVQLLVWLLFLPVMAGLWVWETTWPVVVRLLIVAGLAGWSLYMFLPRT